MTSITSSELTDREQARYADLIYDRTGIRMSPQKKTLLSNRLKRRLRATGIDSFDGYFELLTKLTAKDAEWDAFLQDITTHETYLFRDEVQWNWFRDDYLQQTPVPQSLRIWSAAASTGDEAYTMASCIADTPKVRDGCKVEIIGTDIGIDAIGAANEAKFSQRAMRLVSDSLRRRFFTAEENGYFKAKQVLTKMVTFQQHNLMNAFRVPAFDLIFVKNVLIYFDRESKKTVFRNLDQALKPGGYLVSGSAEGITDLLAKYERITPWLHRKN